MLGMYVVAEVLMSWFRTKILLLLVKVDFYSEGGLGKIFGDKACRLARP